MKQLWRNLNNVFSKLNYNKRKSNAIAKIINEGRDITNQNQISIHFSNYFSTVGEQLLQQSKNKIQNKVPPTAFYDNSVKKIVCFVGLLIQSKLAN